MFRKRLLTYCVCGSVVERFPDKKEVDGSIPSRRTDLLPGFPMGIPWPLSSVGRAFGLHPTGRGFESLSGHRKSLRLHLNYLQTRIEMLLFFYMQQTTLSKRVLVIEDEPLLTKALHNKLHHEGLIVLEGADGQQGLDIALKEHPDLILLDIIMPIMDGITVLKKLREDAWGKTVPVIILTNLSDAEKLIESEKNGVTDYLIKSDWKLEDLTVKIRQTLNKSSQKQ